MQHTSKQHGTVTQSVHHVILQQFSMITQEYRNFTNKVSGHNIKITQAYNTAQENTGKLIENAISQITNKSTKYHYLTHCCRS